MKWLTSTEQQAWIGLLVSVEGVMHASDRQLQRDSGISFATYGILAALSDGADVTLHMSELAGIVGHSQSRLSHAAARLEHDGLIIRNQCPADKRAVHATLTEKGQGVLADAAPAHVTAVRELVFDRLTPEQSRFVAEITGILCDALVAEGYSLRLPIHRSLDENRSPAGASRPAPPRRRR